jgi:signal peptidase I
MTRPGKRRRDRPAPPPQAPVGAEDTGDHGDDVQPRGFLAGLREWTDAIVIAFVLAMFIRTFVVELFKIPSGSMSPTLIGDPVAEVDWDDDGDKDLLVLKKDLRAFYASGIGPFQIFLRDGERWDYHGVKEDIRLSDLQRFAERPGLARRALGTVFPRFRGERPLVNIRYDKIFVIKFPYWFGPPDRGDLVVFKVPEQIWSPSKPIYIKRAVGLPNEEVTFVDPPEGFEPQGKSRLAINGQIVDDPIFRERLYASTIDRPLGGWSEGPPENQYTRQGFRWIFEKCDVPSDSVLALGDNTDYSSDGRYWGTVPLVNLKGRAFLRYWPPSKFGFLE